MANRENAAALEPGDRIVWKDETLTVREVGMLYWVPFPGFHARSVSFYNAAGQRVDHMLKPDVEIPLADSRAVFNPSRDVAA